jgi:hypothetical protein
MTPFGHPRIAIAIAPPSQAIKEYLEKNDLGWMYKSDSTWDFVYRTHKYFLDFGFKSHRAPKGGAIEARKALLKEGHKKAN